MNQSSSLNCPYCRKQYENPKLLICGHTFCASCVAKLTYNSTVTCRDCQSKTQKDSVTENYIIKQIIDQQKQVLKLTPAIYVTPKPEKPQKIPPSLFIANTYDTITKKEESNMKQFQSERSPRSPIGDKEELNFRQRFQFSKNIPNPIPYVEIKDRYYPSKPIY